MIYNFKIIYSGFIRFTKDIKNLTEMYSDKKEIKVNDVWFKIAHFYT